MWYIWIINVFQFSSLAYFSLVLHSLVTDFHNSTEHIIIALVYYGPSCLKGYCSFSFKGSKKLGDGRLLGCLPWYKRGDSGEAHPPIDVTLPRAHPFTEGLRLGEESILSSHSLLTSGSTSDFTKGNTIKRIHILYFYGLPLCLS